MLAGFVPRLRSGSTSLEEGFDPMSKIKFILPLFLLAAPACDDAAKDAKIQ